MKTLSVALAMLDAEKGMVLIDEFENGLHQSVQEHLWKAIFAWSDKFNVQVFATTHSYECINAFVKASQDSLFPEKAKLYRIERKNENFKSIEFASEEITSFIEKNWEIR